MSHEVINKARNRKENCCMNLSFGGLFLSSPNNKNSGHRLLPRVLMEWQVKFCRPQKLAPPCRSTKVLFSKCVKTSVPLVRFENWTFTISLWHWVHFTADTKSQALIAYVTHQQAPHTHTQRATNTHTLLLINDHNWTQTNSSPITLFSLPQNRSSSAHGENFWPDICAVFISACDLLCRPRRFTCNPRSLLTQKKNSTSSSPMLSLTPSFEFYLPPNCSQFFHSRLQKTRRAHV